jgi:hypothetical protein
MIFSVHQVVRFAIAQQLQQQQRFAAVAVIFCI